jgi:ribosomal protein L11 methyltransferase
VPTKDEDWAHAWRSGFTRLEISPDLCVAPPWKAVEGDLVIEPGMAFGTGEHPSTRACLEAIDRLARPGETLLDIGCGTGVLALAGARKGMLVRGIDTDRDAVKASRDNAERNGLTGVFDSTPLQRLDGRFDLVVANLYAEVLVELAPYIDAKVDQSLVLAGILSDRVKLVQEALGSLKLIEAHYEGEWVCLEYQR